MRKDELVLFLLPLVVLLMILRIIVLSVQSGGEQRKNSWINLGAAVFYSLFCWFPALTYEEHYSDLPGLDLGPILLIFFWFVILFIHVLVYWIIMEKNMYALPEEQNEKENSDKIYPSHWYPKSEK